MKNNAQTLNNGMIEVRCSCHRLLARVEGNVVILKCPRCKRETRLELRNDSVVLMGPKQTD